MAVQSLKPRIDMMKARYGDDKDKIQRETKILYEQAGVNPLAGNKGLLSGGSWLSWDTNIPVTGTSISLYDRVCWICLCKPDPG